MAHEYKVDPYWYSSMMNVGENDGSDLTWWLYLGNIPQTSSYQSVSRKMASATLTTQNTPT